MESKFKVGDRVLSATEGLGIVQRILDPQTDRYYPVVVKFDNHSVQYDLKGKRYNYDKYPDLFKDGDIHPLLNVPIRIPKQKVKKQFELFLHKERVQNSFVLEWDNGRFWVSDLMYDKPCISAKIIFEVEE